MVVREAGRLGGEVGCYMLMHMHMHMRMRMRMHMHMLHVHTCRSPGSA